MQPLIRIVAGLFALIEFREGNPLVRKPSKLNRAVLRVLPPAESAVRQLIVALQ